MCLSDQVKMTYVGAMTRVKCEFSRSACLTSETPPADLIPRAKAKLEAVKAAGDIAFYFMYEQRLNEVWKALRAEPDEGGEDRVVFVTLGSGAPELPGIHVEKSSQEKSIVSVTIDAKVEVMQAWRYEWFKLVVVKKMRELGIKEHPSNAQLYGVYLKALHGDKIVKYGLSATTSNLVTPGAKSFSVVASKQRYEIGVVIRNVKEIRSKTNREQMLALITQAVRQMSEGGAEYRVLKKDFLAALQGALDGPEGLGVDLPLVLLAAVGHAGRVADSAPHAGAGRLKFVSSADRMEAAIAGFEMRYYDDPSIQVSTDWVTNELKRCHIVQPPAGDILKALTDAIAKKENINDMIASRGESGSGGKTPFLHPSYKDADARGAGNLDSASLDMREMQQRMTVKQGQLVAEVRYRTAAIAGRNIYGEDTSPPANEDLVVRVGEGIQQREIGRFYASYDGLPALEADAVSLAKVLVHEGDVNLRTGNIRFDGPVEIKGSVDSGAVVEVTGDLIIHGSVRGAEVRAGGAITIKSGVTTGTSGRVHSRGDLIAEFIENSNITCGGNLTVVKALLNSQVIVGGTVKVSAKGGVIAGGKIIAKDSLATFNLGFKNGAVTQLDIGVDWRMARAVEIRKKRLEHLQKRQQDDRHALREIVQKTKAQMTPRHQEMKDDLQDRLTRIRPLLEKVEASVVRCQAQLTYSSTARIYVEETLFSNVSITLCGQIIAVTNDVLAVCIVPKRRRGSYVVPIEEVQAEEKGQGSEPSTKKAS